MRSVNRYKKTTQSDDIIQRIYKGELHLMNVNDIVSWTEPSNLKKPILPKRELTIGNETFPSLYKTTSCEAVNQRL